MNEPIPQHRIQVQLSEMKGRGVREKEMERDDLYYCLESARTLSLSISFPFPKTTQLDYFVHKKKNLICK